MIKIWKKDGKTKKNHTWLFLFLRYLNVILTFKYLITLEDKHINDMLNKQNLSTSYVPLCLVYNL